jgi:hypothetical protein
MPTRSSAKVSLKIPENSGVMSLCPFRDVSRTAFAVTLPRIPTRSSGRGVKMLIVDPMPPVGSVTRPDL